MSEAPQVLIVEDEPVVLKVAGIALTAAGIGFAQATDVPSARQLLATTTFKVVLTDLKLPGESGLDLLRSTRELPTPPEVVMITGYATTENALLSFELGAFDFVPKPFDVDELISVTERALRFTRQPEPRPVRDPDQYTLGRHSWARLDADGSATLGAAETLSGVTGTLAAIDCQEVGTHALQGKSFCLLKSTDTLDHRVRAPLSGQIVQINPEVVSNPALIDQDPFVRGWIAKIIPTDIQREICHLNERSRERPG